MPGRASLRSRVLAAAAADGSPRRLYAGTGTIAIDDLARGTALPAGSSDLAGKRILLATRDHALTGALLVELDGTADRLVLCANDIGPDRLPTVLQTAEADVLVTDRPELAAVVGGVDVVEPSWPPRPGPDRADGGRDTEWVLTTSGTTGAPKLVAHGLPGLLSPLAVNAKPLPRPPVWATFYDIRRYGGLQMFFRGILGTGSLALSGPGEPMGDFLRRLAPLGVTHLAGTPSHWRRALMSPELRAVDPLYARLSGEIADQPVLDALRAAFPKAIVGHAFATTEAGVAFEVNDGRAGFPASLLGRTEAGVEIAVRDGTLRLRSDRVARRVLGSAEPVAGPDGFVDTGDVVVEEGDRFRFAGRRNGVINVGGHKVHPEEVEAVLNRHPAIRMAAVEARRNPITGAIVAARVVPSGAGPVDPAALGREVLAFCRAELAPFKVPAILQVVDEIGVGEAGKLLRSGAGRG